jgi:hypothetical protein
MKWVLRGNEHIKTIEEEFQNGNSWVVVNFDCEYSRRTLSERIKEKEGDWCNLIPEEVKIAERKPNTYYKESKEVIKPKYKERYRAALSSQKEEFDLHFKEKVEKPSTSKKGKEKMEITRCLTIWDLPVNIKYEEIEYMCRSLGNIHIVKVKRSKFKALAVIEVTSFNNEYTPWSLPLNNNKLAQVTQGEENYEQRNRQSLYTAKLLELPKEASEVLLLRSLKSKGAKSVYISTNRNDNTKRFAIITFASQEELEAAQSKPIRYNNHTVFWEDYSVKRKTREETRTTNKNYDDKRNENNTQKRVYKYEERRKERKNQNEENKSIQKSDVETSTERLLLRILSRLDKLEALNEDNSTVVRWKPPYRS